MSYLFFGCRGILKAARRLMQETNHSDPNSKPKAQKFYWLASDGWGKQSQVVKGIEDYAVGAITVELESKKIAGNFLPSYVYQRHDNIIDRHQL